MREAIRSDNWSTRSLAPAALFAAACVLAGCGGGGGSSEPSPERTSPASQPASPDSSTSKSADLVTQPTDATRANYLAGTVERGAWDYLQQERLACGFGLLSQDSRLDVASRAHAYYLARSSIDQDVFYTGHFENVNAPYATGNAPWDRSAAAGFGPSVSEILDLAEAHRFMGTVPAPAPVYTMNEAAGQKSVRNMINTVYHLAGAMREGRFAGNGSAYEVGLNSSTNFRTEQYRWGALVSDDPATDQRLGSGQVATYPCEGRADIWPSFYPAVESPNPRPDITSTLVAVGTPIFLRSDVGQKLTVTSWSVSANGNEVPTRLITAENDPAQQVTANMAFILPDTALMPNTPYRVRAKGTVQGAPFTKDFVFSTGNQN